MECLLCQLQMSPIEKHHYLKILMIRNDVASHPFQSK